MNVSEAADPLKWDSFILSQPWKPFLQSWSMGEVYREIGQEPVRLIVTDNERIVAICFCHVVPAKRGKHLSVPYGPVIDKDISESKRAETSKILFQALKEEAEKKKCSFLRISPFWPESPTQTQTTANPPFLPSGESGRGIGGFVPSPLHLLAEHIWYLKLKEKGVAKTEESLLAGMRKTTRNLVRRASKDGVTVTASDSPERDIEIFLKLHNETHRRHGFTPYTEAFFRAQVWHFAPKKQCSIYLAEFQGEVIATSIHMHFGGETSYHHGASSDRFSKVPASYLLQWAAISDSIRRGDDIYNFWGIAPPSSPAPDTPPSPLGKKGPGDRGKHPFAGVTLFKTGFGGELLNLTHCFDIPLTKKYWLTYWFEKIRKWRRVF